MIYQIVCFLGQEVLYYLVLCTLLFPGYRKYYLTSKMICSTGFLVVVAVMTITSGNTENMLLLLPFFVCE